MAFVNPARRRGAGRIIGALDIGTSKIACLIAEVDPTAGDDESCLRVLGFAVQRSSGVKAGVVTDPVGVEAAVRSAVAQAERIANVTLHEVFVSLCCGQLRSLSFAANAAIGPYGVTQADIDRVLDGARSYAERDGRMLVHMNRRAYRLDDEVAGDDPRGLAASRLSADIHAVTADEGPVCNLIQAVERCDLSVAGLVAAPVASALACTTQDQRQLGVTVVDMGCATTTIAVFDEGNFAHCEVMLSGGHHLTFEIAQNLHTPVAEAERIKTLYASMVNAPSDMSDSFSFKSASESGAGLSRATRSQLASIVRPKVESQLRDIAVRLTSVGWTGGPIVLTGGASQLTGLAEVASSVLRREVVVLGPMARLRLPASANTASSVGAVGLILAGAGGEVLGSDQLRRNASGYFGRLGRWVTGALVRP